MRHTFAIMSNDASERPSLYLKPCPVITRDICKVRRILTGLERGSVGLATCTAQAAFNATKSCVREWEAVLKDLRDQRAIKLGYADHAELRRHELEVADAQAEYDKRNVIAFGKSVPVHSCGIAGCLYNYHTIRPGLFACLRDVSSEQQYIYEPGFRSYCEPPYVCYPPSPYQTISCIRLIEDTEDVHYSPCSPAYST